MRKLAAYIDGFNLYNGLKDGGWKRFYWLDLWRLAEWFRPPDADLVRLKYFSAMVVAPAHDQDKRKRQERYIDALRMTPKLEVILGYYMPITRRCPLCRHYYGDHVEKSTDVSIAVTMLEDAFKKRCDDFLLISGDGDLTSAVVTMRRLFPQNRVFIALPPNRPCKEFSRLAQSKIVTTLWHISQTELRSSQFPDPVLGPGGYPLKKPYSWI